MTDGRGVWRILRLLLIVGVVVFVAIQLVPYGRDHTNPPVTAEPRWDSPQTRTLAVSACFDCHSNETAWPWYTNVAPFSWFTQHDVDDGRSKLNFSTWDRPQDVEAAEVAHIVGEGEMPPAYYGWLHSAARLSAEEQAALIDGLERTLQASPPAGGGG
jgi:hypothetical protein